MNRNVMKKIQLICLACWLSLNVVEAKKIKGYYVNNTDDTIMVTFSIPMNSLDGEPSFLRLQWEVTFLDEKNEKWVLKPGEVKEIVFDYGEEHIRMLSRENTLELSRGFTSPKEYLFLRLMKDGRMKLFKYYYRIVDYGIFTGLRAGVDSGYNPEIHTNDILQKNDGKLFPAGNR